MRILAKSLALLAFSFAPALGMAQDNPVVVELFTSQGCSSCPPADEILTELAGRSDVLALALHVDYWDYIGWKDEFAQAKFTRRQQNYAIAAGARTVYTPQFIVGGSDPVVGAHPVEVMEAVAAHSDWPAVTRLLTERRGNRLRVSAAPASTGHGTFVVQLVRYAPSRSVAIERGENAGRTILYSNIVTDWQAVGEWNGQAPLSLELDVTGPDQVAVILQEADFGRIVAASTGN